jgi:hypothetical protein
MGTSSGAETAYLSRALKFTISFLWVHAAQFYVLTLCFVDHCVSTFICPLYCLPFFRIVN